MNPLGNLFPDILLKLHEILYNNGQNIRILRTLPVAPDNVGHGLEKSFYSAPSVDLLAQPSSHSVENLQFHLYTACLLTEQTHLFNCLFRCHFVLHRGQIGRQLGRNVIGRHNFSKDLS